MTDDTQDLAAITADIVSAHVSNNSVGVGELGVLIRDVHAALSALGAKPEAAPAAPEHVAAVSERKSLARADKILSLIDGKPYSTLKRHLSRHGLTPDQYRQRYGLKPDYPMVAPDYAEKRRSLAHQIGLGRKKAAPEPTPAPAPKRNARKKLGIADAKRAAQDHLKTAE